MNHALRLIYALAVSLTVLLPASNVALASQPNVVLILADDLGYSVFFKQKTAYEIGQ